MAKKILLLLILALSFSINSFAEEEAVDLDTLPSETAKPVAETGHPDLSTFDGLKIHLYIDFILEMRMDQIYRGLSGSTEVISSKNSLSFGQNHLGLIGMMEYKEMMKLSLDFALDFYELQYNFSPYMNIRVGKIFIPFGQSDYHHIYGGLVDETASFLRKFWCDYGVAFHSKIISSLQGDIFVGNGFPVYGNTVFFSQPPTPRDNNMMKSVALRLKWRPIQQVFLIANGYYDAYSDQNDLRDFIFMYGLDVGFEARKFHLKTGAAVAELFDHKTTPLDGFLFASKWYRWAWYSEARYNFTRMLSLQLRAGSMDTDNRTQSPTDQMNLNTTFFVRPGPFEISLSYFYNIQTYGNTPTRSVNTVGSLKSDYQWILLKVLLRI